MALVICGFRLSRLVNTHWLGVDKVRAVFVSGTRVFQLTKETNYCCCLGLLSFCTLLNVGTVASLTVKVEFLNSMLHCCHSPLAVCLAFFKSEQFLSSVKDLLCTWVLLGSVGPELIVTHHIVGLLKGVILVYYGTLFSDPLLLHSVFLFSCISVEETGELTLWKMLLLHSLSL